MANAAFEGGTAPNGAAAPREMPPPALKGKASGGKDGQLTEKETRATGATCSFCCIFCRRQPVSLNAAQACAAACIREEQSLLSCTLACPYHVMLAVIPNRQMSCALCIYVQMSMQCHGCNRELSVHAGRISLKVLNFYINAMGGKLRFSILMSWFVVVEAARVSATVWLSYWTDTVDQPGGAPHGPLWYLMIYTIISGIQVSCCCPPRQILLILSPGAYKPLLYGTILIQTPRTPQWWLSQALDLYTDWFCCAATGYEVYLARYWFKVSCPPSML